MTFEPEMLGSRSRALQIHITA